MYLVTFRCWLYLLLSVLCPQVLKYVDPLTHCVRYYTPRGRFVHVPPVGPRSDWASDVGGPWWRDQRYVVGLLTAKTRCIRVVNTLTSQEQRLQVSCSHKVHSGYRRLEGRHRLQGLGGFLAWLSTKTAGGRKLPTI